MKTILATTRKELNGYFGSPMALIFIGAFLAASLFTFFWVDTFFARGVADVRPLFHWMPVLLIFLVATLTMRQWSEEQRSGTLEMLLTLPVQPARLVLGKFLAVLVLVALALALTLPLVITVAILGNLDFGPVVGGYLAAMLLAGAYAAIGLYVSSRTDNQIVALIVTLLIGGAFYLVGNSSITDFIGGAVALVMQGIGTGSRFESIQRGVIDLRDLVYYLSLTVLFLVLNTLSLDRKRWGTGERTRVYRRNMNVTGALMALNLIALNIWIAPLQGLRADLTEQHDFSLSSATLNLLTNLQEPLLIRAYISDKMHPLLAPLVPRISDMLREYQIASGGKVTAEIIDPVKDPAIETEAGQTYGIQPTPLQVTGRYEASVINTYFDILIRYGDQNTVLNFRDLIDVQNQRDGTPLVTLRNLEYDLTRSIKKVTSGFQSIDAVFASFKDPAKLYLVSTPGTLPNAYKDAPAAMLKVATDLQKSAGGKLDVQQVNPDDPNSPLSRAALQQQFNLGATPVSILSDQSFYLNIVLVIGGKAQLLYPANDFSEASVRTAIESALKRNANGFLKVVGLWTPPQPQSDALGQSNPTHAWQMITQQLSRDYTIQNVDLSTGQVPPNIDMLLVIGPSDLGDKDRYAIDQYLMGGGVVVVAAGSYTIAPGASGLALQPVQNGLADMLDSYGVKVGTGLVMDPQNEPFPSQVSRNVNGMQVREIQAMNYPFFVDVRPAGMDRTSPIVARLTALTLNWVSPVDLDPTKNAGRKTTVLMQSSSQSWLRTNPDVQPDYQAYPDLGFGPEGDRKAFPLAVAIQGVFQSYFTGKPSPLQAGATPVAPNTVDTNATATPVPIRPSSALQTSPDTSRLVVVGSTEFLNDLILQLSSQMSQDRYLNSLQFVQNAVDWSVADLDLLEIRSRGTSTRILQPLTENERSTWEIANYVIALIALVGVGVVWRLRQRTEMPMELISADTGEKE